MYAFILYKRQFFIHFFLSNIRTMMCRFYTEVGVIFRKYFIICIALSEEKVSLNSPEIFSFGSIGIIWLEHDSSSVAAVLRDRRREKHIARQSSFSGRRADALTNQKQIS